MTEDIVQSLSLNKIIVSLLEQYGELVIPTDKLINVDSDQKELVVEYDDQTLMFKFSVRNINEQP